MAKQKTHKGLSKRVKITAGGKVRAKKSFGGHLMSSKNAKRRRRVGSSTILSSVDTPRIKALLGKA